MARGYHIYHLVARAELAQLGTSSVTTTESLSSRHLAIKPPMNPRTAVACRAVGKDGHRIQIQ